MSQQALSKARSHFDHSPLESVFRDLVRQRYRGEHEISLMYGCQNDVLNDFIVDVAIDKAGASERELARPHMEKLKTFCPVTEQNLRPANPRQVKYHYNRKACS
ncbi:hypothetical protein FACS1894187_24480 [Synergistales bacterium]|nr:hypothetical protein FACS1894187_24480 [Synergistales bacterium]